MNVDVDVDVGVDVELDVGSVYLLRLPPRSRRVGIRTGTAWSRWHMRCSRRRTRWRPALRSCGDACSRCRHRPDVSTAGSLGFPPHQPRPLPPRPPAAHLRTGRLGEDDTAAPPQRVGRRPPWQLAAAPTRQPRLRASSRTCGRKRKAWQRTCKPANTPCFKCAPSSWRCATRCWGCQPAPGPKSTPPAPTCPTKFCRPSPREGL